MSHRSIAIAPWAVHRSRSVTDAGRGASVAAEVRKSAVSVRTARTKSSRLGRHHLEAN